MGTLDLRYPLDLTDEEEAAGFEVREASSGIRAIIRDLDNGLRVVKTHAATVGDVQYTVCDAECHPLYPPSKSISEVEARFGKPPIIAKKPKLGDPDILLLLDNLELVLAGLSHVPASEEARALVARGIACQAIVKTWWRLSPSQQQRAAARREVLTVRDALAALQSRGKPSARLAMVRPVLYQAAVLALNAAGGPLHEAELRRQVEAQCPVDEATWNAFLGSEPLIVRLTDGAVRLIPRDVPGGEKAMSNAQYEVVRLVRIARKALSLRELVVLLRYQQHPAASWDHEMLRNVLALEARLQVTGDTVSLSSPSD